MLSGQPPPGNLRQEIEDIPPADLRRRVQDQTLLFLRLFAADRGDRLAGEGDMPDPAHCDACGEPARLGRLLESSFTLGWAVLPGPTVVVCPVPAEQPEDGLFCACRRCWKPSTRKAASWLHAGS